MGVRAKHSVDARSERRQAGLCLECMSQVISGHTLCQAHLDRTRSLVVLEQKRKSNGYQGVRRCGVCREVGHNKQTHDRIVAARATEGTGTPK